MIQLTVYCKDHRRRPVRFSRPVFFRDPQAQIPRGWCGLCGSEIFEAGQDRCVRCRKTKGEIRL